MTEQEFLGAMLAAGIAASGHVCAHGVQLDIGIELGDGHVEVCEFLVDVKTRRMCEGLEHDDWRVVDLGRHSVVAAAMDLLEWRMRMWPDTPALWAVGVAPAVPTAVGDWRSILGNLPPDEAMRAFWRTHTPDEDLAHWLAHQSGTRLGVSAAHTAPEWDELADELWREAEPFFAADDWRKYDSAPSAEAPPALVEEPADLAELRRLGEG